MRGAGARRRARADSLEREIHVWLVPLARPAAGHGAGDALLSDEERRAAEACAAPQRRERYRVAHRALRTLLSRYAPTDPAAWTFRRNRYGRPELAGRSALRFSLSYGHRLVAIAITRGVALGVDLACTRRRLAARRVAQYAFAPDEVADLRRLAGDEARSRFFDYWTLKEAFLKARGTGFWAKSNDFAFGLDESPGIVVRSAGAGRLRGWQLALAEVDPDHRLAVAAHIGKRVRREIIIRVAPGALRAEADFATAGRGAPARSPGIDGVMRRSPGNPRQSVISTISPLRS